MCRDVSAHSIVFHTGMAHLEGWQIRQLANALGVCERVRDCVCLWSGWGRYELEFDILTQDGEDAERERGERERE